jgi:hypothetical protein
MEDTTYEGKLTVTAEVHENDCMTARHILAERLRQIADCIQMGMTLDARIMHPNGHAIGSFKLEQTNLPEF